VKHRGNFTFTLWAYVKREVANRNKTFKVADVMSDAIVRVGVVGWETCKTCRDI
jgi:hypothetical protein